METNQKQPILKPVIINFTKEQVEVLKNTIAKDATEPELNLFVQACISYGLDPFKKELFFSKNKNTGRVDLITSRDGYMTIVQRDPRFNGLHSMEVYSGDEFTINYESDTDSHLKTTHKILNVDREKRGELIGAWATCKFKDRSDATIFVYMDEYNKIQKDNWKNDPSAMIRKVAESIVLKRQGGISGLVTYEEVGMSVAPKTPQLTPSKHIENTHADTPDTGKHKVPKDVTDQYTKHSDESGNEIISDVIQTTEGDMFLEYHVDGEFVVVQSKESNNLSCKTCKSSVCEHVGKVKAFIGEVVTE